MFSRVVLIAAFMSLIFIACTKVGPPGPRGQQGPVGEPGPTGTEQGPKGPPGVDDPETAVKSSEWKTYKFTKNGEWWTTSIYDTLITEKVVNKAALVVYLKGTDKVIHELNYFNDHLTVNADFEPGQIKIQSTYDASLDSIKYVIIPSGG